MKKRQREEDQEDLDVDIVRTIGENVDKFGRMIGKLLDEEDDYSEDE